MKYEKNSFVIFFQFHEQTLMSKQYLVIMRHLWFDYRNRMNIELAAAELKIRMNSDYPSEYLYKYLLTQRDMLKDIRVN